MGFQSSVQTTHKLPLCKQPSNWPFVSTTTQSSHLAMSIKKPLNVTRTMSRKCCSSKQIFRISYQGQTQLDAVYNHRRMFCYHPYIFLFRLLSWIYFLNFEVWRMHLLSSGKCLSQYLVTAGFKYKIGMLYFLCLIVLGIRW